MIGVAKISGVMNAMDLDTFRLNLLRSKMKKKGLTANLSDDEASSTCEVEDFGHAFINIATKEILQKK